MDGARLLDGLITTEFSFIQELIWSAPHKNPFPLCSHSILLRLKNLRGEWRRASPTARQSAMSLMAILDADIKVLIELRKRCLKLLACRDSTSDARTNTVYLAKKVDSIFVQHLKDAWKELNFNFTDTDFQQQKNIDQDCLAADVLKLFVLDDSHKCQSCNKDGTAEANFIVPEAINSTVPEADYQANDAAELGTGKHFSPLQGQSSARDEHSTAISDQEPGFHNLTTETIEDAGRQATTNNTTLQEITSTSNSDENSFKGSGVEKNLGVAITTKPVTTTSRKCDTPKVTLSTSIQAQSILVSDEGPKLSIITPEVVKYAGRRTIGTSQCFPLADQDSTATSEAKPNEFIKEMEDTEDAVEQAVTKLQESSSSATDKYFSASSDDEHDSMIETRTKNSDNSQMRAAIVVNGSASLTGGIGSEISEVQHSPSAGPTCPGEIQIFSSNGETDGGAQKFDEHDQRESPLSGNVGIKDDVKSNSDRNSSKKELVEVEMTLRAKICEPESEEPYWHVMFALLNYSNFKVSVQKLEYWSLDKQEDVTCIHWPPGEVILREQPSFLCHGIKVPCSASNTSPRLAFSWQYSKLPEWIPTKDGKPKIEKGTIQKRLGNMLSFGNAKRKLKHDTGHLSLKSAKKRTA